MRPRERLTSSETHSPESCQWRARAVHTDDDGETAQCRFLEQLFGSGQEEACGVKRAVCESCCHTFPPTFETLNPVVASLVFNRAEEIALADTRQISIDRRHSLRRWAEEFLDIDVPDLPRRSPSAVSRVIRDRPPALAELLPPPPIRCGETLRHWAVGVTTAPRRRGRLDECLASLAQAGWPRPHLFVDGAVEISARWSHLPRTARDEQVGAWPNYYLSLVELLMREPLADAFLMVQDDALFSCRENLREYLEQLAWPGPVPGIVSLYCAAPDARDESGWFRYPGRWKYSSIAFIFPREVARRLVLATSVFHHRWAAGDDGRRGIPDVIADWAEETSTPVYFPNPSLAQHIGETSAIWPDAYELTPNRRASTFLDDQIATPSLQRLSRCEAAAEFPEFAFPCGAAFEADYRMRVARGRQQMGASSAVICGLCRDAESYLSATISRIERLAGMFRRCAIVVYENDSVDNTPRLIRQWARETPAVYVVSERLEQPRLHGTCGHRTERMAYYRNRCRELVLADYGECDYVVVADMDLRGGWSYDGVANTFGHDEWDFVGSNGLSFASRDAPETYEYVDAFAHRAVGQLRRSRESHALRLARGEPLVPVWSCFGGLGIYRRECFEAASYDGTECEHVTFHHSLRERGFERLFLNPSQIVLYTSWSDGP